MVSSFGVSSSQHLNNHKGNNQYGVDNQYGITKYGNYHTQGQGFRIDYTISPGRFETIGTAVIEWKFGSSHFYKDFKFKLAEMNAITVEEARSGLSGTDELRNLSRLRIKDKLKDRAYTVLQLTNLDYDHDEMDLATRIQDLSKLREDKATVLSDSEHEMFGKLLGVIEEALPSDKQQEFIVNEGSWFHQQKATYLQYKTNDFKSEASRDKLFSDIVGRALFKEVKLTLESLPTDRSSRTFRYHNNNLAYGKGPNIERDWDQPRSLRDANDGDCCIS